jgi:hypothetical protein
VSEAKERNVSGRLKQALDDAGAVLKRSKKHLVYELPNGKSFTIPSTPSDSRADLNAISDLRKVAGIEKAAKPPRKERREKQGRREADWSLPVNRVSDAMPTNLLAAQLREAKLQLQAVEEAYELEAKRAQRWRDLAIQHENNLEAYRRSAWVRLGQFLKVAK